MFVRSCRAKCSVQLLYADLAVTADKCWITEEVREDEGWNSSPQFRKSGCSGLSTRREKNTSNKEEEREENGARECPSQQPCAYQWFKEQVSVFFGDFFFFWSGNQWSLSRSEGSVLHWLSTLACHFFFFSFLSFYFLLSRMSVLSPLIGKVAWGQFEDEKHFIRLTTDSISQAGFSYIITFKEMFSSPCIEGFISTKCKKLH